MSSLCRGQDMSPWDTIIKTNHDSVKTKYDFDIKSLAWKFEDSTIIIRGKCYYGIKGTTMSEKEFIGSIYWDNIGVTYNKNTTNLKYTPALFKEQCRLYFIYLISTIPKE